MKGPKVGQLFPLQFSIPSALSLACSTVSNQSEVWHKRLGHPNSLILHHLFKHGFLGNKDQFSAHGLSIDCTSCKLGKTKILPFPMHGSHATKCFNVIHSDVWGITPVALHARYKYFVTFIDDYSHFTWVYFLRSKVEVLQVFQTFVAYLETQFSTCLEVLRSDNGGEYISHAFQAFLQQKGIISQRSCPYTSQQNVMVECKNRHLLDVVPTLLLKSSVPSKFWVEALSTAVYLINHLPSQILDLESPYYHLFGSQPSFQDLHTFGCVYFVHLPSPEYHKLAAQSVQCAFLGYSVSQKDFVYFDTMADRILISRYPIFFENQYFFQSHIDPNSDLVMLPNFDDVSRPIEHFKPGVVYQRQQPPLLSLPLPDLDLASGPEASAPRWSSQPSHPSKRYGFLHTSLNATLAQINVLNSYSQATAQACWVKAMDEELQALQENHTWDIVSCPSGVKPIGCI